MYFYGKIMEINKVNPSEGQGAGSLRDNEKWSMLWKSYATSWNEFEKSQLKLLLYDAIHFNVKFGGGVRIDILEF